MIRLLFSGVFVFSLHPKYRIDRTGKVDATAGLRQAALDAAGGVLFIAPGTYSIAGAIDAPATAPRGVPIPQNTTVLAIPGTVTITQPTNANVSGLLATSNYNPLYSTIGEFTNVWFIGLTFNGNNASQSYNLTQDQFAVGMFGSNMNMLFCRFYDCGNPAITAVVSGGGQITTGALIGESTEQMMNGARPMVRWNRFENCSGVALWNTALKGDTYANPPPGFYGNYGLDNFSDNVFFNCVHGQYVEDRVNGFVAEGIIYKGNQNTLSTNGSALSIIGSVNGKIGVLSQYAGSGLTFIGYAQTPDKNLVIDAVIDSSYRAGINMNGNVLPLLGTLNGAATAGSTSVNITITQGSLPDNGNAGSAWVGIVDGASSEYVQVVYTHPGTIGNSVMTLYKPLQYNHSGGQSIVGQTGVSRISGKAVVSNSGCGLGGGSNQAGVSFNSVWNVTLMLNAYDSKQEMFPPGTSPTNPPVTQLYGVSFSGQCKNIRIYGDLAGNATSWVLDDGSNTGCGHIGIAGQDVLAGTTTAIEGDFISTDPAIPSRYYVTAAPSNNLGKNGDFAFNKNGGAATTIYQKRAGSWVGIV